MSGSESESADDDDDDSASSEDDTPVAPKKKSKAEISFAQRVQNVAISDDVWRAGRDLEAVLDAPREMTTLVQTTNTASLTLTLPLARAIINKSNGDTIPVPVWRKKAASKSAAPNVEEIAIEKFERYYKDIQIGSLQQPAQDGLKILAVQFEERFFADKNITNRDLIALKLDPSVNLKRVLVDKMLIARADRAYNEMYWKTERELGKDKSPNKAKKKKSRRSAARPAGSKGSLLERMQLPPDSDDDSDDISSSSDSDDDENEMPKLDALRNSKKIEAYYGDNGLFDVLALWSDQLDEQPVHALMAQRIFIDLPSESISETVFSIHENFASDLRRGLRPTYIAAMVRNNQNHHLFFDTIKDQIKTRFYQNYRPCTSSDLPGDGSGGGGGGGSSRGGSGGGGGGGSSGGGSGGGGGGGSSGGGSGGGGGGGSSGSSGGGSGGGGGGGGSSGGVAARARLATPAARAPAAREPYFQTVHGPLDPSLEYDGAAAAATAYVADADALGAWDAAMAEDDGN
jgi:hypothetical protein